MSSDVSGSRTYSDAQFREHIPEETGHYTETFKIANAVGCVWQTANRRIADLARDESIDIVDLEAGELVDPNTLDASGRPMFGVGMDLATALEESENGGERG